MLAKTKLNIIEVLISIALIESYISHDEFALVNNVWTENDYMEREMKYVKTVQFSSVNSSSKILIYLYYIDPSVKKYRK